MTASQLQQTLNNLAGQARSANPLALALPCVALAFSAFAVAVGASAPDGPKCVEPALSVPGFESLTPQVAVACIRVRF